MQTPSISQILGRRRYDHTNDASYSSLLNILQDLQNQLLANPHFRTPYLGILQSVASDPKTRRRIRRTQCPTDADIRLFFREHWPEVQVDNIASLGFTKSGPEAVNDCNIQVCRGLVCHLREAMAGNNTTAVSEAELRLLFISVILHELGHRLLVWWSQGECDYPSESGNHIEKAFFTGTLGQIWSAGKLQTIKNLQGIVLNKVNNGEVMIDESTSDAILQKLSTPLQTLPLMDVDPPRPVKITRPSLPKKLEGGSGVGLGIYGPGFYETFLHGDKVFVTSADELRLIYMN